MTQAQTRQAEETVKFLASSPLPVVIGGDTNAHFYHLDLKHSLFDGTTRAFLKGGYADAHARLGYSAKARKTITHKILGIFNAAAVVDVIVSDRDWAVDASICNNQTCQGTSDHFPILATFDFAKLWPGG